MTLFFCKPLLIKPLFIKLLGRVLLALGLSLALSACGEKSATAHSEHVAAPQAEASAKAAVTATGISLDVYKSPTCGCCELWIEHLEANGIAAHIHHPEDLDAVKNAQGILPVYQSCHTAISADGYSFEGHIPAHVIVRFLAEKPEGAIGLAVPGMPLGSPGMELRDRLTPYDVLLLKKDGSSEVYEHIDQLVNPSPAQ